MAAEDITIASTDYAIYRNNLTRALRGMFSMENILSSDPNLKPLNTEWRIRGTVKQLCSDVMKDVRVLPGDTYLGEVYCSGLPNGMLSGTVLIQVTKGATSKLLTLTVTSADVAPYTWQQFYYLGNLTGWKSWTPMVDPSQASELMFLRNGYLGVGNDYTDILNQECFHQSVMRGIPIPYDAATRGYIWAVYPSTYTPILAMNLVKIPMEFYQDISVEGESYKVWKSIETHIGSFNFYFF